jgi:poly-beta-1,6-N-acetyl-D-glucosamine biosynthesis protein PgaD
MLLWGVWLYWILPIVVIILWLVGVPSPAQRIFTRGTFAQLHSVLVTSGLALLLIALAELLWVGYNRLVRKRTGRRRRKVTAITYRHLYEKAGLSKATVEKAQKLRRLQIVLADGKLTVANLNDPTALRRKPSNRNGRKVKVES